MTEWQELASGGYSLDIGQWEIFISPNRPPHGWNVMILAFNHVVHRLSRFELEQAKQSALTTLIAMLDEWKAQAQAARDELTKGVQ